MGNYFSNIHIKNNDRPILNKAEKVLTDYFSRKRIIPSSAEDADFEVTVFSSPDSDWTSVYCDGFTPNDILDIAPVVSETCGTDVLSISCFDSDYMFINLVNANDSTDAWLNIGELYDAKPLRRSNISAWKKKVSNFEAFKNAAKEEYVFAEDFLNSVKDCFGFAPYQYLGYETPGETHKLYFSCPKTEEDLKTKLEIYNFGLTPCQPGERSSCFAINNGGASQGIAVYFTGDYVENEEIVIKDAEFAYRDPSGEVISWPIFFEKVELSNGKWAYRWKDEAFEIPEKVPDDLSSKARIDEEFLRSFGIYFTPKGNKRKFLDIAVTFLPLSNPMDGQCLWKVWLYSGSKRNFIEEKNKDAKNDEILAFLGVKSELIDPNDYDLD